MAAVQVLEKSGCSVHYPLDQTCCGMPAFFDGFREQCKEAGEQMIKTFLNDRYTVSLGSVCCSVMKYHYNDLFHNSSLHNEYKHFQKNLFEFSTFLEEVLGISKINRALYSKAVFAGGCTGVSGCLSHDPSIRLLHSIEGLELLTLKKHQCCGWGGTLARNDEKKSVEQALAFLKEVQDTGAELIISNEMGCLMHLAMVMNARGITLQLRYVAELF